VADGDPTPVGRFWVLAHDQALWEGGIVRISRRLVLNNGGPRLNDNQEPKSFLDGLFSPESKAPTGNAWVSRDDTVRESRAFKLAVMWMNV
jgi:hypothetical protein